MGETGSIGKAGCGPSVDLALSRGSQFLYSLNAGDGSISAFRSITKACLLRWARYQACRPAPMDWPLAS